MEMDDLESCCAVDVVNELCEYTGNPQLAMRSICRNYWGNVFAWNTRYLSPNLIPAFIVFTSVEKADGEDVDVKYGSEFAAYIKDNNLGSVTRSVKRRNRQYHPDHTVQVFVWAPDVTALAAWYKGTK